MKDGRMNHSTKINERRGAARVSDHGALLGVAVNAGLNAAPKSKEKSEANGLHKNMLKHDTKFRRVLESDPKTPYGFMDTGQAVQ